MRRPLGQTTFRFECFLKFSTCFAVGKGCSIHDPGLELADLILIKSRTSTEDNKKLLKKKVQDWQQSYREQHQKIWICWYQLWSQSNSESYREQTQFHQSVAFINAPHCSAVNRIIVPAPFPHTLWQWQVRSLNKRLASVVRSLPSLFYRPPCLQCVCISRISLWGLSFDATFPSLNQFSASLRGAVIEDGRSTLFWDPRNQQHK